MGRTANNDPCRSRDGKLKERWPNSTAAWFVVLLCSTGDHGLKGHPKKLIAYHCSGCEGWHLATCRNAQDRKKHRKGLEELQRRLTKITQRAGKK